ncbi:amidase [Candidatus Entotheonella palauensis]|uniref:amidase n=1 Tax=Candidatus Entotheonella palauensis TaxID=93172 RepID=UPI000B7E8109|nr:amidase [Candidatus Entotheonella palauensis]
MSDIAFKPAVELARMIKDRDIGCLELLEHYLARVEQYNPALNAIIVMDEARARTRAREADQALARGEDWGPLHGVPMTCKESYDVEGLPTTFGIVDYKDNIATSDALAIQRLKAAGAVVFGKTNVPLRLADFQSYNDIYGTTNNPWNIDRIPGGSSGGTAAALAAGLTGFDIGSDIGGSIRNPSHYCGIFGHKPTWGLLPTRGHALPGVLAEPDLAVIGPLGRSAADLEMGVQIMAGPDDMQSHGYQLNLQAPSQASLAGYRVAVWRNDDIAPVNDEVADRVEAVAKAVAQAGGTVDDSARPDFDAKAANEVFQTLLQANMAWRLPDDAYTNLKTKVAQLGADDRSDRAKTMRWQVASYREAMQANESRTHLRWAWHEFFKHYDVMVLPIAATPAFEHDHRPFGQRTLTINGEARPYFQQVFWAGLAICSYLPGTIIPTGPGVEGLPIGVQIIGPAFGDLKTIGFAKLLEQEGFTFTPPPGYGR